jgi:hypothetical protein
VVGYTEVIQDGHRADQYPGSRPVFRNSDRASTPGYRDPGAFLDTNPADDPITSGLPVIWAQSSRSRCRPHLQSPDSAFNSLPVVQSSTPSAGNSCCESVDSNLHLGHFSSTTFISIDRRTMPLFHCSLKHFRLTPVPDSRRACQPFSVPFQELATLSGSHRQRPF